MERKTASDARRGVTRGVTLVELCVVMALIAILSTTVISFSILINNYAGRMAVDRNIKEGVAQMGQALDIWLSVCDSPGYQISASPDGSSLVATDKSDSSKTYTLYLGEDAIEGTLPTGNRIHFEVSGLDSLSFSLLGKADPADPRQLIRCTITHKKPFVANDATETTLLVRATRAGEVLS